MCESPNPASKQLKNNRAVVSGRLNNLRVHREGGFHHILHKSFGQYRYVAVMQ